MNWRWRIRQLNPLLRILLFLGILALIWLPVALPFYWLADSGRLDLGGAIATGLLYVLFLGFWPWWSQNVYQLRQPWQKIGIIAHPSMLRDWLQGLGIGIGSVGLLTAIQVAAGWALFRWPEHWLGLVLEGVLVGILVGLAEEILFRGWLLFELEQGFSDSLARWINALLFAAVHFIKPLPAILATLPQFLGLLLLGLLLVWGRHLPSPLRPRTLSTSLGWPVGLHSGLVGGYYLVSVGSLLESTQTVPAWVTGIQQNPLAGLLGLIMLGTLLLIFRYAACHSRPLRRSP